MTDALVAQLGRDMAAGQMIPFLGPDLLSLTPDPLLVPAGARDLAHRLNSRVRVPGRIANNMWHASQYIESFRHRITLDKLMMEIFDPIPAPSALHQWLAGLRDAPLIIDTWYDATLAACLSASRDPGEWGLLQGASKARRTGDAPWYRAHGADGAKCSVDQAQTWRTILYKPHGATRPAGDVLASDADYVEVLSDIDIQTPIPQAVQDRRRSRGFVFLGCRFYDQILRTFTRCLIKHSAGPYFAVVPPEGLTRNEVRFLETAEITPIAMPLAEAAAILTSQP